MQNYYLHHEDNEDNEEVFKFSAKLKIKKLISVIFRVFRG
jgi:hypothetical protein